MKLTPSLLTVAVLAGLMAQAHAAPDASTLDTVRVEAKRGKNARSNNQNVKVMTTTDLEDEMANNFEDAIRYIPGVSIVDMGRFGDNGFNIRGLESDRVAMTIDGLSMGESVETARSYEFFRSGRGDVDIDTLKSMEVIKGADAITAGSGALGGAVVFITKDPADYLRAKGNTTYTGIKLGYSGSNDERMGTVTFANRTAIVESMLVYTKREGHETESFRSQTREQIGVGRSTPDPIDSSRDNLLGKVDFVLSDAHRVGLVFERGRATNEINNLSRVYSPGYLERRGHDSNNRDRYGLRYIWNANNTLFDTLQLQADQQETESRGVTRIIAGIGTSANPIKTPRTTRCTLSLPCLRAEDRSTDQTLKRVALDFDKRVGIHSLIYGVAWQERNIDYGAVDYRWNNAGVLDMATVDPRQVPRTDVAVWNLYLRDSVRLLDDRLTLAGGARYDRYDYSPKLDSKFVDKTGSVRDLSFASPTWQASAEFRFLPTHSVWAQLGRGFRAPSVSDMYSPTSTTTVTSLASGRPIQLRTSVSNPDLRSERSLNAEIGYRWMTHSAQFGVSLFRDRYSNFIESTTLAEAIPGGFRTCATCAIQFENRYIAPTNAGEVTVKGVEVEGRWSINDAWSARLAASYSEGEKKNGDPLESIVPASGVVGLRYAPSKRWNLTGSMTHAVSKSAKDAYTTAANGAVTTPAWVGKADGYTVFDLHGGFNITDNLRVTAGLYNLTNQEYYLWQRVRVVNKGSNTLYGYVNDEGIGRHSEPGRNARVTVAYHF